MILSCQNIFFNYNHNTQHFLINNFSCIFNSGTITVIVGDSGSGKSTLLSLLTRTNNKKITSGSIIVTNEKGISHSLYDSAYDYFFSDIMSYVPQKPYISDDITFYNLAFFIMKKNNKTESDLEGMITFFKINHIKHNYYKTFSGGEKYRAAVVLGLLKNHKILILDEPTAHLDDATSFEFMNYIIDHTKKNNIITIIASHDKKVIYNRLVEKICIGNY